MEPENLKMKLCINESELSPFLNETACLKEIDEYETDAFRCKISLKYDYEESEDVKVMSSGEEFQLLVDESYENDRIEKLKEERKMSENIIRSGDRKSQEELECMKEKRDERSSKSYESKK